MKYNLKIFYSWKMLFVWVAGLFFLLYFIYQHSITDDPKNKDIINKHIKVSKSVDSLSAKYSTEELLNHNKLVISTLQERESTANSVFASKESTIKQSRTIYIAILVALLSFLFNKKSGGLAWTMKYILLLFTITVMYFVEVHSEDLLQRQENCKDIISKSTENLVNSTELSTKWFALDYRNYLTQIDKASESSFYRKLIRASHPSIEQKGIYVFPYMLILIAFLINIIKQKKSF